MKGSTVTLTRHERRLADREDRNADRRERRRKAKRQSSPSRLRSPIVLITVGALVLGAALIGIQVLGQNQPADLHAEVNHPEVTVPVALADGRALGRPDAPVTIEIWSDFQCPACRSLAETVEPRLVNEYVTPGTVRLVYRDAAFQGARAGGSYDESVEAAAGARCAADQGLFWEMHNFLFANWNGENRGAFATDRLRNIATAVGLDVPAWQACLATGDAQTAARAETSQAVAAGVTSTPTLVINGTPYVGVPAYADLERIIALEAAGS